MFESILSSLFSFRGRRDARSFRRYVLSIVVVIALILSRIVEGDGVAWVWALFAVLVSALAVITQRLRDLGRPGVYILMFLLPHVGLIYFFRLLYQRGTIGPNRFGPDPLDKAADSADAPMDQRVANVLQQARDAMEQRLGAPQDIPVSEDRPAPLEAPTPQEAPPRPTRQDPPRKAPSSKAPISTPPLRKRRGRAGEDDSAVVWRRRR